ncbi:response regulator [Desulfurivibrio dismutans]|uniref:response regulator n=1 Tax=Desulfurivibrio dismutans TaxID=1398908 RepID=UPI0023DC804D|nr:response regulator [Desulfurivibrio alkaliphilus]MDF1613775.1 response regulator [Desulfurivibrio alkaliphilus]
MTRILIVDDDHELRETIKEVIEQENFQATTAQNADEALALVQHDSFDLIILDMVMPGTDGMNAIPLLRRYSPGSRIVVITAFSTVQNAVQALRQGAHDYLSKPFTIETLLATIGKNLQEASFTDCAETLDSEDIFQGLANQLRRQIIFTLKQQGNMCFMELVRALAIEDHTKVNFHLKVLREAGFIEQDQKKCYILTSAGEKAASCLAFINKNLGLTD